RNIQVKRLVVQACLRSQTKLEVTHGINPLSDLLRSQRCAATQQHQGQ
ncbi:MAG: hypothetical protein RL604_1674, partial [Pseudomonadota bacterium]